MKFLKRTLLESEKDTEKISIWTCCLAIMDQEDAYQLATVLMNMNIEYIPDYLEWGRRADDVGENGQLIVFGMSYQQKSRTDRTLFYNLGRLHESLKDHRNRRDARIKAQPTSPTLENDKKRLRIEAEIRDRG